MVEWLSDNKEWITTATSIGTLLVWIFYAQLLYSGYSRQRRPRVLINKGVGEDGLDSPCLICNMSQEAVFIYFILVVLETNKEQVLAPVIDCEREAMWGEPPLLTSRIGQGPVESGQCLELSSFRAVLERVATEGNIAVRNGKPVDPEIEFRALEFHVVCIYGSDDTPFGAIRRFRLDMTEKGAITLIPESIDTTRKTSWRYRRRIRRWLERYIH